MGQLLENTVLGGGLILLTALIRRVLRGRISPNVTLVMWALCAARLLTPVKWKSPVSVFALFEKGGHAGGVSAAPAPQVQSSPGMGITGWLYIAAALVLAALMVRSWLRVRRSVRGLPELARVFVRQTPLPGKARLRVGRMDGAPLTFGVVRPEVVVTPELKGRELELVLEHEAVHARRGDNLWHYLTALILAAHWFNPAVWLMAALVRRDVEMSCDRAVLRHADGEARAEYAGLLVHLSTGQVHGAFSMGFGMKKAEERIVGIMKFKKTTIAGAIAAACLIGCAGFMLAGTPAQAAEEPEDGGKVLKDLELVAEGTINGEDGIIINAVVDGEGVKYYDAEGNELPTVSYDVTLNPEDLKEAQTYNFKIRYDTADGTEDARWTETGTYTFSDYDMTASYSIDGDSAVEVGTYNVTLDGGELTEGSCVVTITGEDGSVLETVPVEIGHFDLTPSGSAE